MNTEMEGSKTPDENLFVLVAKLAQKLGKTPLNHRLFIHRIDEVWTVVVNGCEVEKKFREYKIPPGYCFVEFAGWPAALFSPYGGFFEGVEGAPNATEAHFVRVIKEATTRATVNPEEEHA